MGFLLALPGVNVYKNQDCKLLTAEKQLSKVTNATLHSLSPTVILDNLLWLLVLLSEHFLCVCLSFLSFFYLPIALKPQYLHPFQKSLRGKTYPLVTSHFCNQMLHFYYQPRNRRERPPSLVLSSSQDAILQVFTPGPPFLFQQNGEQVESTILTGTVTVQFGKGPHLPSTREMTLMITANLMTFG